MTREEIYENYHTKVQNMIYGKTGDRYLAEDITSTVFLKVYEKLESFDEAKASVSTWIYTIANNTLIDYFRTRKVTEEVPEDISELNEIDEKLINEEQLNILATALKKLPERERELLVLRYYDNMKLKDIAAMMNMSYANAKVVQKKALERMKGYLADYRPE